MMNLKSVLKSVASGQMTLDDVSEWVKAAKPLYERPPLEQRSKETSRAELDDLIDRYSDWEIRAHELNRLARDYMKHAQGLVQEDPDLAVKMVKTLHVLTGLSTDAEAEASAALQV